MSASPSTLTRTIETIQLVYMQSADGNYDLSVPAGESFCCLSIASL